MLETLLDFLYILNRYLHIICTTVIVGGTLFFELIVPVATGELKAEQQMLVFGRARWGFRTMVWTCAFLLILTGIISSVRRWQDYSEPLVTAANASPNEPVRDTISDMRRPGWWWAAHVSSGMIALIIAASLMTVRRPPDYPLYWMRLSLTILLIVIFFGTTARHMRLSLYESEQHAHVPE
jgi:hypothetical protein